MTQEFLKRASDAKLRDMENDLEVEFTNLMDMGAFGLTGEISNELKLIRDELNERENQTDIDS